MPSTGGGIKTDRDKKSQEQQRETLVNEIYYSGIRNLTSYHTKANIRRQKLVVVYSRVSSVEKKGRCGFKVPSWGAQGHRVLCGGGRSMKRRLCHSARSESSRAMSIFFLLFQNMTVDFNLRPPAPLSDIYIHTTEDVTANFFLFLRLPEILSEGWSNG